MHGGQTASKAPGTTVFGFSVLTRGPSGAWWRMTYSVTITSTDGNTNTYSCAGSSDQQALIYAGKVVEEKADHEDPEAKVSITKDGKAIGPESTVGDMMKKAI